MKIVLNISTNEKKLQDPSDYRQTRPTRYNSGCCSRRKVKHWTPKGVCKVTDNEERNHYNFMYEIALK